MSDFVCRLVPNLRYGPHERQELDLYLPESSSRPVPIVLMIHGGGWRNGDRGRLAREDAFVQAGFALARTNYRLTDTAPHPAQIDDCRAALDLLRDRAGALDLDAESCFTIGHSAGGHLASLLGCIDGGVKAVANQAGPVDFPAILPFRQPPQEGDPERSVDLLLGGQAESRLDLAREASPLYHINATTPPHLLVFASDDAIVPYEQAERFLTAMKANDRQCELMTIEQGGHGAPDFWQPGVRNREIAFFRHFL